MDFEILIFKKTSTTASLLTVPLLEPGLRVATLINGFKAITFMQPMMMLSENNKGSCTYYVMTFGVPERPLPPM